VKIREAGEQDLDKVLFIERKAFGEVDEANLVRDLLIDPSAQPVLSLLAWEQEQAVGHILFTSVSLDTYPEAGLAILAPLAVIPEKQNRGIGGQLIKQGLALLGDSACELVFVLGYPDYYSRFGFRPAGKLGFDAPYPIEDKNADAWMVCELKPGSLERLQGTIQCAKVLDKEEYWRE